MKKLILIISILHIFSLSYSQTYITQCAAVTGINITQKECDGILQGKLKISNITVNGVTGPSGLITGDDTAFLQRALNLYKDMGYAGFIILEANKTYRITNRLLVQTQGVTIQGMSDSNGNNRSTIYIDFAGQEPGIKFYAAPGVESNNQTILV
ncbi:MAG: hypothetical protein R3E90_13855 [Marinicella sp.]